MSRRVSVRCVLSFKLLESCRWKIDGKQRLLLDQDAMGMLLVGRCNQVEPFQQWKGSANAASRRELEPIMPDVIRAEMSIAAVVDSTQWMR